MNLRPSEYELAKFKNDTHFESFCLDLFKHIYKDSSGQKYGRPGQTQHGIDLYFPRVEFPQAKKVIQCKVRSDKLTLADIKEDLEKFKGFPHEDYEIVFATTADRCKDLQNECLKLNVMVHAWEDLIEYLDTNLDVFYQYFISDKQKEYFNISTVITLANDYYDNLMIDSSLTLIEKIDHHFHTLSKEFKYQISLLKAKIFETKSTFSNDISIRDEIAEYYSKVTKYCEENSIEKYLNKAKAYFVINESKKGLDEIEKVLKIESENEKAINLKIANLAEEKELKTFLDTIDPLLKVKPTSKALLAVFYYKNKNYNKAKELLTEALRSSELKELEKLHSKALLHQCILFSESPSLKPEAELSNQKFDNLKNLISEIENLWNSIKDKEISKYFTHILLPEINARTLLLNKVQNEQEFHEALKSILKVCENGLEKCLANSYVAFCFNHQKIKVYLDLQEYKEAYKLASELDLKLCPSAEILLACTEFKIGNFIESQIRFEKLLNDATIAEEHKKEASSTYHKLFALPSLLEQAYFLKMTEPTERNERNFLKLIWSGNPESHLRIEKLNSRIDKTIIKENVAVKIKMDSGAEEFFILETNKKIPSGNKIYHPEHRLFKELLGKKIGDAIILNPNHIPEERGIIEDILLKYYPVADINEFNEKYPDRSPWISGRLPDNPTLYDFENFVKAVTERFKRD